MGRASFCLTYAAQYGIISTVSRAKKGEYMRRRTPEQQVVDGFALVNARFEDLWELVERTGVDTAKVWASRNAAAGTTFGSLMQETSEKLYYLWECAELLRDEAVEE